MSDVVVVVNFISLGKP